MKTPWDLSVFVTVRSLRDPALNVRLVAVMLSATMVPALILDSAEFWAYNVFPTLRLLATLVTLPLK